MSYKRHRSRKPLKLETLQLRLTDTVEVLERIIQTSDNDNKIISAVHALSQITGSYMKMVETINLEERIKELEDIIAQQERQ